MGHSRYVGRVGNLAVALGVGAAVTVGWGSGSAWADDTGSAASSSDTSEAAGATSSTKTETPSRDDGAPDAAPGADTDAGTGADPDADTDTDADDTDADADAEPDDGAEADADEQAEPADHQSRISQRRAAQRDTDPEPDAADAESSVVQHDSLNEVANADDTTSPKGETAAEQDVEVVTTPEPDLGLAVPAPVQPDVTGVAGVVETAIGRVTSALSGLFDPFSSNAPDSPAAAAPLWSILAFARREFGPKPSAIEKAAEVPAISEPLAAVEEVAAKVKVVGAQAAVQAEVVQNSLTYTAKPTLIDKVTVFALRALRTISAFIGIDLYGNIGKLLSSASPPFFVKFGLDVKQTEFEVEPGTVWKVWEFAPPEPSGKTVIAVHGGGFILQPILLHWIDYSNMARETGATVVVPMYPLATTEKGAAVTVVPAMADFISAQIDEYGAENVSIYADSAGPTLTLGAVRELIKRGDPLPASMVLISFGPDPSLSNPDAYTIDDPVFDLNNLEFYAASNHWGDGLESTDPMIAPLFMEPEIFQQLPPTTVYTGDLEFTYPDNLLFHQRAVEEGVPISLVVGLGQYHNWAFSGLPINSQAPKVRDHIYRQLGLIT